MRRSHCLTFGLLAVVCCAARPAVAQPWDLFVDPLTGEACDLVNAANVEMVVFSDTGELVIVTGADLFLGDTFVDADGNVFFDGFPFGFINFDEDGDGLPSLWWLTEFGTVVEIDLVTFVPFDSFLFPDEFVSVPCDACPFWDDPDDCDLFFDSDGDGVPDEFDECPGTFPGEIVDDFGCSCEDLGDCDCFFDEDLDGVADCDDFCPNTPIGADVDFDGCACFQVDDDADGIDNCDDFCPNTPPNAQVDVDGCTVVVVNPGPIVIGCGNFSALMVGLTFAGLYLLRFTVTGTRRATQRDGRRTS
jgi:hypothetical protein